MASPKPSRRQGRTLAEAAPKTVERLERRFIALIESDPVAERRNGSKVGTESIRRKILDKPLKVTSELLPLVRREFGRIVLTGTMSAERQLKRPSHELAVALFLLRCKEHEADTPPPVTAD